MNVRVKNLLRLASFLSIFLLVFASPLLAKKGKKGREWTQIKPEISADQAVTAVKETLPKLSAGKAYIKSGKRGDKKLEVPLLLDGKVVSRIKLNAATGEILSKGQKVSVQQATITSEQALDTVQKIIPTFQVCSAHLGKHGEWKVELTFKGAAIADIGVNGKDGSILPDLKASKDAGYPAHN